MVKFIQAQNIGLAYLEERFSLQIAEDEAFFTEWFENLSEITDLEKQDLDRIKLYFLRLVKHPPLSEETVKLVVLSPLLNLARFYDEPFYMRGEESIEIFAEDEGEIIRGIIDILVIQEQFWLLDQFFMKLHRIRSPLAHASRSTWGDPKTALAPLIKGGTGKTSIKVPLFKGDLGGSRYVQLHIKLVLVIESKRSSFSLLEAIPQALVYMLANPNQDKPTFGLVTNGSDFIFLKLTKENQPKYAISDQFTLLKR
ncbi:restriction endonuclease subunit R [Nostoc sp.]